MISNDVYELSLALFVSEYRDLPLKEYKSSFEILQYNYNYITITIQYNSNTILEFSKIWAPSAVAFPFAFATYSTPKESIWFFFLTFVKAIGPLWTWRSLPVSWALLIHSSLRPQSHQTTFAQPVVPGSTAPDSKSEDWGKSRQRHDPFRKSRPARKTDAAAHMQWLHFLQPTEVCLMRRSLKPRGIVPWGKSLISTRSHFPFKGRASRKCAVQQCGTCRGGEKSDAKSESRSGPSEPTRRSFEAANKHTVSGIGGSEGMKRQKWGLV